MKEAQTIMQILEAADLCRSDRGAAALVGCDGAVVRPPPSADETAFLALGPEAATWLVAAGAPGTERGRRKMAEAVVLAKVPGADVVSQALAEAASGGRFADGDCTRRRTHQAHRATPIGAGVEGEPPEWW
jgi:hypothetical protein